MEQKKLHVIQCCPDTTAFWWQSLVQLDNAREMGFSDKMRILVFTPDYRKEVNPKFKELESWFPEARFFFYKDQGSLWEDVERANYQPLIRPYMLYMHFKEFPELSKDAIFYIDADVLFTRDLGFLGDYLQDDVCYLSDTNSYMGVSYFDSHVRKLQDLVDQGKVPQYTLDDFKTRDILSELASAFTLTREQCIERDRGVGGAQSLLKNATATLWRDVYIGSIFVRMFLAKTNYEFFPDESAGFQSWGADMWALLYNLWNKGIETQTPKVLDFAWATDSVEDLKEKFIFHNAGIDDTSCLRGFKRDEEGKRILVSCPAFYKGKTEYGEPPKGANLTPFEDIEYVKSVVDNPVSAQFGTHFYAQQILKTKELHSL